ncbi:MAG: C10 family peptidase [Muribaculaceae bacterium]|nr:C10 family peptidase [Muribaculaceae bacterium]
MKKLSNLIALMLTVLLPSMANASSAKMLSLAETFLSERLNLNTVNGEIVAIGNNIRKEKSADFAPTLSASVYAYNAVSDKNQSCFVLLAEIGGDARIIGYSDNGNFDSNNMPEAMQEWLTGYTEALASAPAGAPRQVTTQPVEPLLKTKWHQRAPYNNFCPTYDDHRTVAGCTAIALSQVLFHFKSDNTAPEKVEYVNNATKTEISVDFSKGGYDWANMLPTYTEGEYSDAQADAVARLCYEAGVASKAEYGFSDMFDYSVSNFSTKAPLPYEALQRYFNYKCDIMLREYVPTQMWIEIIYKNLLNNQPIIYSGSGKSSHAFVVDGVDSEGMYHVNWGWNDDSDGYFDLTYLRIDDEQQYGKNQQMIANIAPRTASDEPYAPRLAIAGCSMFGYSWVFPCVTTNYRERDYFKADNIRFAAVVTDNNGNIVAEEEEYFGFAYPGNYVFSSYDSYGIISPDELDEFIDAANLSDGTYLVNIACKRTDDDKVVLSLIPKEFQPQIKITKGQYELINAWDTDGKTEVRNVYAASDVFAGSDFYLGFTLFDTTPFHSYGMFQGGFYFENCESGELYKIDQSFGYTTTMPGVEQEVFFKVRPTKENGFTMVPGRYKFVIENTDCSYTTDDFYIDVEEKPSYPVLDYNPIGLYNNLTIFNGNYSIEQNSQAKFKTDRIYSANLVGGIVRINIYATPVEGGEEILIASIPDVEVKANSGVTQNNIRLTNNFYPLCGTYDFTYRYVTDCGERSLLHPNLKPERHTFSNVTSDYVPLTAESQVLKNDYSLTLGEPQTFMIEISNNNDVEFEGIIDALFMDIETGKCAEGKSEHTTIAAGETKSVPVTVTFEADGNYDVYLTSTMPEIWFDSNWNNTTTPLADLAGRRTVCKLTLDYASIGQTTIDESDLTIVAIYDLQGKQLKDLQPGINIVKMSNGKAKKIMIK